MCGKPFFSVITVTLNAGAALGRTRDSVASQGEAVLQHVVKDGGSTDGSVEILDEFGNSDGVELLRQSDRGIYDAMNQALSSATGEYVHFLNAGDCYSEAGSLRAVREFAVEQSYPDVIVVWYRNLALNCVRTCPRRITQWFLFRNFLCHQAVFIRNECLGDEAYDANLKILGDQDLVYRLFIKEGRRFAVLPVTLVNYDGGGISASQRMASLKRREKHLVRSRYFSLPRRIFFGILHELTLVRVRNSMFSGTWGSRFRPAYLRLAEILNRL